MSFYTIRMAASSNTAAHDMITVKAPTERPLFVHSASITAEAATTSVGAASLRRGTTMGTGSAGTVQEWDVNDVSWASLVGVDRKTDLTVAASAGNPLHQHGVQLNQGWFWTGTIYVPAGGIFVFRLDVLSATTTLGAELVVETS